MKAKVAASRQAKHVLYFWNIFFCTNFDEMFIEPLKTNDLVLDLSSAAGFYWIRVHFVESSHFEYLMVTSQFHRKSEAFESSSVTSKQNLHFP